MSSRSDKTEKLIESAYLDLCLENNSLDISVSSVAERAGIGRSTFYLYYEDIYALIECIQSRLLDTLQINISNALANVFLNDKPISIYFVPMAMFLKENKKAVLTFIGKNGSAQFMYKFKNTLKNHFRSIFPTKEYTEYLLEYMVSANLGLILYWLENDCVFSLDTLVDMLTTVFYKGPFEAFLQQ